MGILFSEHVKLFKLFTFCQEITVIPSPNISCWGRVVCWRFAFLSYRDGRLSYHIPHVFKLIPNHALPFFPVLADILKPILRNLICVFNAILDHIVGPKIRNIVEVIVGIEIDSWVLILLKQGWIHLGLLHLKHRFLHVQFFDRKSEIRLDFSEWDQFFLQKVLFKICDHILQSTFKFETMRELSQI